MRQAIVCTALGILASTPLALKAQEAPPSPPTPPPSEAPAVDAQSTPKKPTSPLCFKVTRLCVERKASADETTSDSAPLDLELDREDMQWVLSQLVLRSLDEEGYDSIEVRGQRDLPLGRDIPPGLASIYWAIKNPKEAWRIFTPIPSR